uniref:Uncharacterized protein n=1 Tax=Salmo trutta TaxID=8032 RepID=A0A673WNN8_SALTR
MFLLYPFNGDFRQFQLRSSAHVHHRRHHWAVFLGELSKQSHSMHNSGPVMTHWHGGEGMMVAFRSCLMSPSNTSQAILLPHSTDSTETFRSVNI